MATDDDLTAEEQQKRNDAFYAKLSGTDLCIWDPHEHLLAFLKTQKNCCQTHILGEPDKWDRPQPLFR